MLNNVKKELIVKQEKMRHKILKLHDELIEINLQLSKLGVKPKPLRIRQRHVGRTVYILRFLQQKGPHTVREIRSAINDSLNNVGIYDCDSHPAACTITGLLKRKLLVAKTKEKLRHYQITKKGTNFLKEKYGDPNHPVKPRNLEILELIRDNGPTKPRQVADQLKLSYSVTTQSLSRSVKYGTLDNENGQYTITERGKQWIINHPCS